MADLSMDTLLHPPFEANPPVKLNIPAKTLGLVLAILYAIFALFSLFGVLGAMGIAALSAALGVHQIFILVVIGAIVAAISDVLVAWGGYKMYQSDVDGKRLVIYGLALGVLASVVGAIGALSPFGIIATLVINGAIWYLVIISRFPGEAPLAPGVGAPPPQA